MARRIPNDAMTRALSAARVEPEAAAVAGAGAVAAELPPDLDLSDADDAGDEGEGEVIVDEDAIPEKLYFRIGEVATLVGVDAHVLRYWESEFRMRPHRSSSGQRLYRKQDLARFFRIKRLLHDEGYTIAGARKALAGTGALTQVDVPRIRESVERLQALRDRILELRDEIEADGVG